MKMHHSVHVVLGMAFSLAPLWAQASLSIALPERTRLLEDQRVDLVIEARNATGLRDFRVTANEQDITAKFSGPTPAHLDCDASPGVVYRANLVGFSYENQGNLRLIATANSVGGPLTTIKDIKIQRFALAKQPRNIILFIGDAMGTAYRDAARLVARSVETAPGVAGMREGFFDNLLEMDKMQHFPIQK